MGGHNTRKEQLRVTYEACVSTRVVTVSHSSFQQKVVPEGNACRARRFTFTTPVIHRLRAILEENRRNLRYNRATYRPTPLCVFYVSFALRSFFFSSFFLLNIPFPFSFADEKSILTRGSDEEKFVKCNLQCYTSTVRAITCWRRQ